MFSVIFIILVFLNKYTFIVIYPQQNRRNSQAILKQGTSSSVTLKVTWSILKLKLLTVGEQWTPVFRFMFVAEMALIAGLVFSGSPHQKHERKWNVMNRQLSIISFLNRAAAGQELQIPVPPNILRTIQKYGERQKNKKRVA